MLAILDHISELGIGAIFAIMIIKELYPYFTNSKSKNGEQVKISNCITRPEFIKHQDLVQYKENCAQVQKTITTRFDGLERLTHQRFKSVENGISDVKELIKNGNK